LKKEIVFQENLSQRLDLFLAKKLPLLSRRQIQKEILAGNAWVNQKRAASSYRLKPGDKITLNFASSSKSAALEPWSDFPLEIVFRNLDFAVIEKPAGVAVHPVNLEAKREKTLVESLLFHFPEVKNVGEHPQFRPGIVHRLDKETSGIMLVALNQNSYKKIKRLFQERKIEKRYLAVVWGKPRQKEGQIVSYLGKPRSKKTRQAVSNQPHKIINPKKAITFYRLIETKNNKSLLEVIPKTGRTHQIRVHLNSLGLPIVGDKKYTNPQLTPLNRQFSRHLLHAYLLKFSLDEKEYNFQSPKVSQFKNSFFN